MIAQAQKPIISSHRGVDVVLSRAHVSAHVLGEKRLMAHHKMESFPTAAAAQDYLKAAEAQAAGGLGGMLNNRLGCCTIAGVGHGGQVVSANTGAIITPPDSLILTDYERVDGYVDGDPSTDNGGVETDVLAAAKASSVAGVPVEAWIPVNPGNIDHCMKAIERYGGFFYIGISLPLSAQNQTVWTFAAGAGDASLAGSWGGHCVVAPTYDGDSFDVETWGMRQKMSRDFWLSYVDEAYAVLCPWLYRKGGLSPMGDSRATLISGLPGIA
jgi:hypothetical protein